jgi:hypothetical protein
MTVSGRNIPKNQSHKLAFKLLNTSFVPFYCSQLFLSSGTSPASMDYVGKLSNLISSVSKVYNELNPATLSGAIDIVVVEQPNGELACSPFHVRFGKLSLLMPQEKKVRISLTYVIPLYACYDTTYYEMPYANNRILTLEGLCQHWRVGGIFYSTFHTPSDHGLKDYITSMAKEIRLFCKRTHIWDMIG